MEPVQQSNRLQKCAPPPLEVKRPAPDLFNKSNSIPLLSPISSPRMEGEGDRPDGDPLLESESEIADAAATRGRSWIFVWDPQYKTNGGAQKRQVSSVTERPVV